MDNGAKITTRSVEPGDLDALARLYARHWCAHVPDEQDKLLVARHNVVIELVRSPFSVVAEYGGEIVGVCLGCATKDGKAPVVDAWLSDYERIHAEVLERAKTADALIMSSLFGDQHELATADEFIAQGSPYAEAQLCLIMVDPTLKGQRLGSTLLGAMTARFRDAGAGHYFLMTDTSSDYAYYEHRGMARITTYPEDPENPDAGAVFIYGEDLV